MKNIILTSVLLFMLSLLCACSSSNNYSYNDGMSERYHTDKQYRDNVNSSADAYGVSPREAESSAYSVLDALY